jgi:flagellar hook protein FlgE
MSVIGTATSGMSAALQRFDSSASAIARQYAAEERGLDLADEVVKAVTAKADFEANAAVARTGSKMVGSLVDILA